MDNAGWSSKWRKIIRGWHRLIPEVLIRSGILIITVSVINCILVRLMRDNVCTLCTEAKANKVTSLRVRISRFKSSCGHNEDKYEITGAGSQVSEYFGLDGFKAETPLKNRLIFSSEPRLELVISDNAERYELSVPYVATL